MKQTVYIYAQRPEDLEFQTLGRLTVENGVGQWIYSPNYKGTWVPDEVHYPLRKEEYIVRSNNGIPGFVMDLMPDNWGKSLIKRLLGSELDRELTDIDYLRLSQNADRFGNLTIGEIRNPPKKATTENFQRFNKISNFIELVDKVRLGEPIDRIGLALFQTSSLGGARPKITLRDDNNLFLAKPKDMDDLVDTPTVEYLCLRFAASKGFQVCDFLHEQINYLGTPRNLLILTRFDRTYNEEFQVFERHPMLSALSLLDATWISDDTRRWSYPLLANEMLRKNIPTKDIQELYKRMAFNALIGNDDDHPKNHAFIYKNDQWRLAPLFDVVPNTEFYPTRLAMKIGEQGELINRSNLLSMHTHFRLSLEEAIAILDEVASWEDEIRAIYNQELTPSDYALVERALDSKRLL
ncbi:type II toxin-antitoxin system HipA family toxin [Acinetobacter sp. ULE_I001]|uniref:type II toxin-antitoxin system HipA family toxin n=1 Tax=unclassified Acinetobacter TaxID=196816 RepID=UPI003AF8E1EC